MKATLTIALIVLGFLLGDRVETVARVAAVLRIVEREPTNGA